ncbi:hypothetical protein PIB30_084678 [Stylosanthes scabra]|uniref:Uncharacterized protein n=1 Tax=Stylosanthes scabra TaxID=79078 RepID=A0ABU6YRM1_9FABA|nr:hypothetical protein [Stylosanthes scabra]
MRPIAPLSPRPAASPNSSTSLGSTGSVHREHSRSPRTPLPSMAPAPAPGPMYPVPRTPICDARRYRSLFPRRRVAPPTPPPPSPPPSHEELSVETYDPATELVGDRTSPLLLSLCPTVPPRPIIRTLLTDRSVRVPVLTRHLPAITPLVVLPAVCPWAMGLPQAGRPVTKPSSAPTPPPTTMRSRRRRLEARSHPIAVHASVASSRSHWYLPFRPFPTIVSCLQKGGCLS